MKLIFKYLKPYVLTVIAIVLLTYAQVQTELALPDYMSDIVTNGIQYGGIEEEIPLAITKKEMDVVLLFSEDDETILKNYDLVLKDTCAVVDNQEVCFEEDVYVLKEDHEDIASTMQEPLVFAYYASQQEITINQENVSMYETALKQAASGLEDNYSSMVKIYLSSIYEHVGLSCQKIQSNYILHVGLIMLGISAIAVFVQLASTYLATKVAAQIAAKMRKDVFEKVESFSSNEFSKFSTSSLITRSTNDITKIQQLIQMMLRMMLMSPMMGLTAVFKVAKYPSISWILIVAIGVIISTMIILAVFAVPKFTIIQKLTDRLNGILREFLDGMLVIRAFNSENKEEEKFDEINLEYQKIDKFVSSLMNLMSPVMTLVMNGLTIAITWFAAKQIDLDVITIGDMMAFYQYAMHVVMSFMFVAAMFFMIPRSLVSANRIKEILDSKNTILDPENPKELPSENALLEFKNVSFQYPGAEEKVLENISFTAKPGETIAFIGSTGSGKSTIVKLIPRLFDVSEGEILYGGINIKEVRQKDLHELIGYASQKAVLFMGDIASNVSFGRDVSKQEMDEALRIAQAKDIIAEKPQGVHSPISQSGSNVSGGQKQRISIARALAKQKNIYIFDDTFSALDYATDKELRKQLNELIEKTKSTVILVAQRIATIKNADKIIVLDDGKIVGEGKHSDLLKNCEVYQQIAYSQLSKEELA